MRLRSPRIEVEHGGPTPLKTGLMVLMAGAREDYFGP